MPSAITIVVFSADDPRSAITRLRFSGPAQHAGFSMLWGSREPQEYLPQIAAADLIIIQRDFPRFRDAYPTILHQARLSQKPVVYETDDLLLDMGTAHSHYEAYRHELLPILAAVTEADAVTTSTQTLADILAPLNPNRYVLPNALDDSIWKFPVPAQSSGNPVTIGYMGGQTHQSDLALVAPVLQHLLDKYADLELHIWGVSPPSQLVGHPRLTWTELDQIDYTEFVHFFQTQACSIFIAPLQDTQFNRAKSGLKFLEYSALGISGVYSDLPEYRRLITPAHNGFLANTSSDWEAALSRLITDPALRLAVGRCAQETVVNHWRMSSLSQRWIQTYQAILAGYAPHPPESSPTLVSQVARQSDAIAQELHAVIRSAYQRQSTLEAQISADSDLIDAKNRQLASAQSQIDTLGERVRALELSYTQLQEILASRSWRIITKINTIRQQIARLLRFGR